MSTRRPVRGTARLAMEAALSYSLGLVIPPDPLTGSNATTELNPDGVKQLEDALSALEDRIPGIGKILAAAEPWRARTRFLTKVGYHGLSNSSNLAVNMAYEDMAGISEEKNPFHKIFMHYFKDILPEKPRIKHGCVMTPEAAEKFHEDLKAKLKESRPEGEEPEIVSLEGFEEVTPDDFMYAWVERSIRLALEDDCRPTLFQQIYAKAAEELRAILKRGESTTLLKEDTLRDWLNDEAKVLDNYSHPVKVSVESVSTQIQRRPAMKLNKFTTAMLTVEELTAHQLENARASRERMVAQLGEVSTQAIEKDLIFKTIVELCADGILKNIGQINEQLERLGCPHYGIDNYARMFDPAKFEGRLRSSRADDDSTFQVVASASDYLRQIENSGLCDIIRDGNVDEIAKIASTLASNKFPELTAELGSAIEYTDEAVDAFLAGLDQGGNTDAIGWEKAFLTNQNDRGSSFWYVENYMRQQTISADTCTPQSLFRETGKLGPETTEIAGEIARNALKAARILDRAVYSVYEIIEAHRCANIRETISIIQYGLSKMVATPPTGTESSFHTETKDTAEVALEAIAYANGFITNTTHDAKVAEGLKSDFFWSSKPKQTQRQRESRKAPADRDVGYLQSEQQEYLAKAIAKFSDVEELRNLHYVGIVNQYPKYTHIAQACNLKGFDAPRYYAPYTKAQGMYTEFMLDWILALYDKNSKPAKLVRLAYDFGDAFSKGDNMKTIVDAVNGNTSSVEVTERVAMRIIKEFNDSIAIQELKKEGIEAAKDTLRPKNRYKIELLEELAMQFGDYESNLGGLTLYNIYNVYQKVCWQLHAADAIADYYNRTNRALAVEFMAVRGHLFAIADLLAFVLYGQGALRSAAANMMIGRINFIDDLLDL